jgi:sec-independent protein translocase protein TatA
MLGLDNPIHIAFVLVLLLLVFGAKRLPEMGQSLGHGLRGFKEAISGDGVHEHLTASASAPAPVHVDQARETVSTPVGVDESAAPSVASTESAPMQPIA